MSKSVETGDRVSDRQDAGRLKGFRSKAVSFITKVSVHNYIHFQLNSEYSVRFTFLIDIVLAEM